MKESIAITALAGLLVTAAACSSQQLKVTPELRLASAVESLGVHSELFKAQRREAVRTRRALLADELRATSRITADLERRRAVWKITADQKRITVLEQLLAATEAAAQATAAQEALEKEQAKAVKEADTTYALGAEQLGRVVKALTTLGTTKPLADQAKLYVKFVVDTKGDIDKAMKDAAAANAAASAAERDQPPPAVPSIADSP